MTLRPIGETAEAEDLYGPFLWGDVDLYERFLSLAEQVRDVAPDCVGMSASLREHGITLTVMAADRRISTLDAVQYVDGGPCVDALREGTSVSAEDHAELGESWPMFSEAARRYGVCSTLSLPVRNLDEPMAGFNLYGGVSGAFAGLHEQLSDVLGTWAEDCLVDADPTLAGLVRSRLAPTVMRQSTELTIVATLLAQAWSLQVGEAEQRLRDASERAVIPLSDLLDVMRHVLAA
ncbi:hypothetical protein [Nocardioides sp.]|jgi:hypothetical protein|uniref:hypothetical protein n=1 Tax=Nocardioides sp. TaxID=35761 RepID=UPI00260494C9|nr:hypothetical protein [Nocardioides sp.]